MNGLFTTLSRSNGGKRTSFDPADGGTSDKRGAGARGRAAWEYGYKDVLKSNRKNAIIVVFPVDVGSWILN
ncbi:MAG: hypothetical protein GXP52_06785 [Deltaproteobacteria bacterium]|nr:hypothetical protein [Deltaproteobacteria bacterium]